MIDDDRSDDLDEAIEDLEAPAAEQSDVAGGAMMYAADACKPGTPTCFRYSCADTAVFCGNPESKVNFQRLG